MLPAHYSLQVQLRLQAAALLPRIPQQRFCIKSRRTPCCGIPTGPHSAALLPVDLSPSLKSLRGPCVLVWCLRHRGHCHPRMATLAHSTAASVDADLRVFSSCPAPRAVLNSPGRPGRSGVRSMSRRACTGVMSASADSCRAALLLSASQGGEEGPLHHWPRSSHGSCPALNPGATALSLSYTVPHVWLLRASCTWRCTDTSHTARKGIPIFRSLLFFCDDDTARGRGRPSTACL